MSRSQRAEINTDLTQISSSSSSFSSFSSFVSLPFSTPTHAANLRNVSTNAQPSFSSSSTASRRFADQQLNLTSSINNQSLTNPPPYRAQHRRINIHSNDAGVAVLSAAPTAFSVSNYSRAPSLVSNDFIRLRVPQSVRSLVLQDMKENSNSFVNNEETFRSNLRIASRLIRQWKEEEEMTQYHNLSQNRSNNSIPQRNNLQSGFITSNDEKQYNNSNANDNEEDEKEGLSRLSREFFLSPPFPSSVSDSPNEPISPPTKSRLNQYSRQFKRAQAKKVGMAIIINREERREDKSEGECSICTELLNLSQSECYFLPCFHSFHQKCLYQWFERANQCPNCRAKLKNWKPKQELGYG